MNSRLTLRVITIAVLVDPLELTSTDHSVRKNDWSKRLSPTKKSSTPSLLHAAFALKQSAPESHDRQRNDDYYTSSSILSPASLRQCLHAAILATTQVSQDELDNLL